VICLHAHCRESSVGGGTCLWQVTDFKHGTVWRLMIASYEILRKYAGELVGTCDLLVRAPSLCDYVACCRLQTDLAVYTLELLDGERSSSRPRGAAAAWQVCDEGHRLKSAGGNKTIDSLLALRASRRILLTGTPLQNNLDEVGAVKPWLADACTPAQAPNCMRAP